MPEQRNDSDLETYIFSIDAVKKAIDKLSNARSHNHLPGYLSLLYQRNKVNSQGMTVLDIETFHKKFFKVKGAPAKSPYLQPFRSRGKGPVLLNKNLQGSYAPSSIRAGSPFSNVVELVDRSGSDEKLRVEYRLKDGHAEMALSSMLSGHKIPALSLAAFLFRDFGLMLKSGKLYEVIETLKAEFDMVGDENEIFDTLFLDDSGDYSENDLVLISEVR